MRPRRKPFARYSGRERKIFQALRTPAKIQDFLETLPINFEKNGDTCHSPRTVLRLHTAHCMEGALLAAAALEFHGRPPLVLDLRAVRHDFDHVVAPFEQFGRWGAISKTNHAVLRYREPVYRTIRELVLSYFHEYFMDDGKKTLREYSQPLNLTYFDSHPALFNARVANWRIATENLFAIPEYLDGIRHYPIVDARHIKKMRKADTIEIKAGKLVDWQPPKA